MNEFGTILLAIARFGIGILLLWGLSFTVNTDRTSLSRPLTTNLILSFPALLLMWFALSAHGMDSFSITVPAFSQSGILLGILFLLYCTFTFGLIKWMYRISVPETLWIFLALAAAQHVVGKIAMIVSHVQVQ